MAWIGTWYNQYGSTLKITSDANGEIRGSFRTALHDSGFFGQELPVVGAHRGACASFTFAGGTAHGNAICSFTGVLQEGKLETVWHVVSEGANWPHAVITNADTFVRNGER